MPDSFLVVDEVDGSIYTVPRDSLVAQLRPAMRLKSSLWTSTFVNSCRDSTCFVNAETVAWACSQQTPCLVFKSVSVGCCVYAQNMEVVNDGLDAPTIGGRFIWPMSYHGHDCVWARSLDGRFADIEHFPPKRKCDTSDALEQRPRPLHILGATRLDEPGVEMSTIDRVFFLNAITGRFVFRDATECINSFVRHTRKRKETFPDRMRFNSQIHRYKQLQRNAHCDSLKRRACEDPEFYKDIKMRAAHGMKFLESVVQNTGGGGRAAGAAGAGAGSGSAAGAAALYSVGSDAFSLIMEHVVAGILKTPNSAHAATVFVSLLSVDRAFKQTATGVANRLLCDAKVSISKFVLTGRTPEGATERLPWLTYSRFGCSPSLLLRLEAADTTYKQYFELRLACKLNTNVSLARAHARGAPSSPHDHAPFGNENGMNGKNDMNDTSGSENGVNGMNGGVNSMRRLSKMKTSHSFEFCNPNAESMPMRIIQLYNIANGNSNT